MPQPVPRTRFAPTPSGYLHEGNAVNALLVWWQAIATGGQLVLRIDDMDRDRYRPEYVDDILSVVDWLGLPVDIGPSTRSEFETDFSLLMRQDDYWERVQDLPGTYACICSRRDQATGRRCECRSLRPRLATGESALRLTVPAGTVSEVDDEHIRLDERMGDVIVWGRDGRASYHLASVLEDERMVITHIVRGSDLRESTAAQRFLAAALGCERFLAADIVHHGLITGADGGKLSKSQSPRGPMERHAANRHRIEAAARSLAAKCRIPVP